MIDTEKIPAVERRERMRKNERGKGLIYISLTENSKTHSLPQTNSNTHTPAKFRQDHLTTKGKVTVELIARLLKGEDAVLGTLGITEDPRKPAGRPRREA